MLWSWSATPAAPSNLVATAIAATQVNLTWMDNSGNETGFQIQRATGGGAFATIGTVGANVTSFSDLTTVATTTYSYQIVAVNGAGSSSPSNIAMVTTPGAVAPPAAPTNLVATLLGGALAGSARSSRDNANNETGFVIERADNGGAFLQIATSRPRSGTGTVTYLDTHGGGRQHL